MATSTFPTLVTGVTVQTATAGALSGDGSSGNKLAVGVDGVTVDVNGSDQLEALGAAVAFKTIAVSGQSSIVADAKDDTLTIAAGSGVTLTTNAGTDTLTIAASGGGGTPAGWTWDATALTGPVGRFGDKAASTPVLTPDGFLVGLSLVTDSALYPVFLMQSASTDGVSYNNLIEALSSGGTIATPLPLTGGNNLLFSLDAFSWNATDAAFVRSGTFQWITTDSTGSDPGDGAPNEARIYTTKKAGDDIVYRFGSEGTFQAKYVIASSSDYFDFNDATHTASFYANDQAAASANPYYSWFDSRGVRRVKEDATFDSVGQAIEALYNPQYAKYSAGTVFFERGILGQFNGNVFEIGTELGAAQTLSTLTSASTTATATKTGMNPVDGSVVTIAGANETEYNGSYTITRIDNDSFSYTFAGSLTTPATGTITARGGTLRNTRIIGGGFEFGSSAVAPASSGTRYLCISTAGVVTSSSSACSGT